MIKLAIIINTFLLFTNLQSQTFEITNQKEISNWYLSDIRKSSKHQLYSLSIGFFNTILLDTNLITVKSFEYEGGGSSDFSPSQNYLTYAITGSQDNADTIAIYTLGNDIQEKIPVKAKTQKFFNTSDKVLFTRNGDFGTLEIPSYEVTNKVFSVGTLPYEFFAEFAISKDDRLIFTSTPRNTIEIYNTQGWKLVDSVGPFEDEVSNLVLSDSSQTLIFSSSNSVFIYDYKNKLIREKIDFSLKNICTIAINSSETFMTISGIGSENNSFLYNLIDRKITTPFVRPKGKGTFASYIDETRKVILIPDLGLLYEYHW